MSQVRHMQRGIVGTFDFHSKQGKKITETVAIKTIRFGVKENGFRVISSFRIWIRQVSHGKG